MELCRIEQCTGCMACYNACGQSSINIEIDKRGFAHPVIDNTKCIECGKCVKTCPVLNPVEKQTKSRVYAGWIKDSKTRKKSSSGGLFSALAYCCLDNNGVVFGAQYSSDYKSVEHGYVENKHDLAKLMTSKYVQSNINESYRRCKEFLLEGREVLFSGTPCQIAGLRAYLNKSYENLLTIDIVCHGVPSPGVYKDYLSFLEEKRSDIIKKLNFRLKKPRWGNTYLRVDFQKSEPYIASEGSDPFYIWSNRNYSLRDCCHNCAYTSVERVSDITIADFWGFSPRSFKETSFEKGTSLVLINSPRGLETIDSLYGKLFLTERSIDDAIAGNQMLKQSFETPEDLESFWKDYETQGITALFDYGERYQSSSKLPLWILRLKRKYGFLVPVSAKHVAKRLVYYLRNDKKGLIMAIIRPIYRKYKDFKIKKVFEIQSKQFKSFLKQTSQERRIFYLGVCRESNLGDMAQYYCIQNWLRENYPSYKVFEAGSGLAEYKMFIKLLSQNIKDEDRIVFQSGYGVQDLGGNMNRMHRAIFSSIPQAKYLMFPNTIFFKSEENKKITSDIYNSASKMLFLARDEVSYDMAKNMFPDIRVMLFPDIVTTLIGNLHFHEDRNGIIICRRNDLEQYYSDEQWDSLSKELNDKGYNTDITDTTIPVKYQQILRDKEGYIYGKIREFAKHEIVITDRFHGMIFSLTAGTPVIITKTTDHKVVSGMNWFKKIYPDYIYYADDLEDVNRIVLNIREKKLNHSMISFFKEEYYDKLKSIFENEG